MIIAAGVCVVFIFLRKNNTDLNSETMNPKKMPKWGREPLCDRRGPELKSEKSLSKTKNGETALMDASREGHVEIVQAILDKGTNVNAKDDWGRTALMLASQKGHKDHVELLLAKGADVNARASNGDTALMLASDNGHKEVRALLIKAGAKY